MAEIKLKYDPIDFDKIPSEKEIKKIEKEFNNMICVSSENHPYINELDKERKPFVFIPYDETHIEIMGHRIDGYNDLQEFLKDLEECKEAQHRWNELKVFLMKYRREKSRF